MRRDGSDSIDGFELPLLLAFEALLQERSITRAARRLDLTQPTMSARLGTLRRVFGDRLFVPASGSRGVIPTTHALALEPLLATALEALRGLARHESSFDPATSRRTFRVAMHDNPAMMLGPGLISRIRSMAPVCHLAVVTPDRETVAAQLERG